MGTNNTDNFVVLSDDGKDYKAEILDIFQVDGYDNNYVLYTFGESVDDNNKAYISKIVEKEDGFDFVEVEDPKEWETVNNAFKESLDLVGGVSK